MKARNLPTSLFGLPAGYRNWLDYWQKQSGKRATTCGFLACPHEATTAMIVEIFDEPGKYYILPECFSCSKFGADEYYEVNSKLLLVYVPDTKVNTTTDR